MHKLGHNKQGEKLGYDAKAATRFVKAVSVGDVQWHSGVAFVPLRFHGQSFLLHQVYLLWLSTYYGCTYGLRSLPSLPLSPHPTPLRLYQIRKMVAVVAACTRGSAPADAIHTALTRPRVPQIPLAPGGALTLIKCWYALYANPTPTPAPAPEPTPEPKPKPTCNPVLIITIHYLLPKIGTCRTTGSVRRTVALCTLSAARRSSRPSQ